MIDTTAAIAVSLRSGTLHLQVDHADLPLSDLCGFASRRSRKRGFVFVSKVLGKHYPVRPSRMAQVHELLANKLGDVPGPAVCIALAETATALGQGIFEAWLRRSGRDDLLFLHTTRYRLRRPALLDFQEVHSHATDHIVYQPADADAVRLAASARSLVLVDDEISTGRTLGNLAAAYRRLAPDLGCVDLMCLTDWLGAAGRAGLEQRLGVPVACHSLLAGSFRFEEDPAFDPGVVPDVTGDGGCKDAYLNANHGRLGLQRPLALDLDALIADSGVEPGQRLLVLGSGEFAYPPYLLARRLEQRGWDVHYQSTTRSPLLVDGDLHSVLEFGDNYHDGIPNYVYNATDRRYDRVLIGYETYPLPAAHTLPALLGAKAIFF
jgi:hypothetical protein